MRRTYQAPLSASISRSIGSSDCNTFLASLRSAASEASELRSVRVRPISAGTTLKRSLVAGVKNRIVRSVSRRMIATSVLYNTFCRSWAVSRCRSSDSCVSSSLRSCFPDCRWAFQVAGSAAFGRYPLSEAAPREMTRAETAEFGEAARSDEMYLRGRIATPHFLMSSGACSAARLALYFGISLLRAAQGLTELTKQSPSTKVPETEKMPLLSLGTTAANHP